jgi:peroxidase
MSFLYGEMKSESDAVRTFSRGQLRLTPGQFIPVSSDGKLNPKGDVIVRFPSIVFMSGFFSRNHNKLAEGLAKLNPKWDDEKIFQETRRINIAIYQNLATSLEFREIIVGKQTYGDNSYNENINSAATVEFTTALRIGHYFSNSSMYFVNSKGEMSEILVSDSIGNRTISETLFDDAVRGAMKTEINFRNYEDDLHNKLFKNKEGFGVDLFAFDVQRGEKIDLLSIFLMD